MRLIEMVQFFWRGFYSVFMVIFQERSLGSFEKTNVCAGWEVIFGQTGFFLKTNIEYRVLCVQSEFYHNLCLYIDHKYGIYFLAALVFIILVYN